MTDRDTGPSGPILIRPDEAARRLAISLRQLRELTVRGRIPVVRLGRSVRYSLEALQSWALEASDPRLLEVQENGQKPESQLRRRQRLPAGKRREMGRGRPRRGEEADALRSDEKRSTREA